MDTGSIGEAHRAVDTAPANPATEQTGDAGLARFIKKLLITLLVLALALAAWRLADLGYSTLRRGVDLDRVAPGR